jgi:hypothetical protein
VNSFDKDYRLLMILPPSSLKDQLPAGAALTGARLAQDLQISVFPSYFRDFFRAEAHRVRSFQFFSSRGDTPRTPKAHWVSSFVAIV